MGRIKDRKTQDLLFNTIADTASMYECILD